MLSFSLIKVPRSCLASKNIKAELIDFSIHGSFKSSSAGKEGSETMYREDKVRLAVVE